MSNSAQFTLFCSLRSPFARRIRLALTRVGIAFNEEIIDVFHPPAHFLAVNPLGTVPTLVGPGGFMLSDSAMILEWIDSRSGAIFPHGPLEWELRQATVLCEGVIQSVVSFFIEEHMHEAPSPRWISEYLTVIDDTLKVIESMRRELFLFAGQLTQAGWDLAVALEYMSLRIPAYDWKHKYPSFTDIVRAAHRDAKFAATVPRA